jgi:NAD(P)-dependent dehydrogenase (short-subunit alcohol dehydrogenase family)
MGENGIKRRRTAIVTGASKGIGAGIANAFLLYGVASLPLGTPVELEVIFEVTAKQRVRRNS